MRELRFLVIGVAQTKGSARAYTITRQRANGQNYTGARVDNDNPKAKGWASTIAHCAGVELALPQHQGKQFSGPVEIEIAFFLPRPKKYQTRKWAGVNVPHQTKPDVDKLVRCAKDALTKVVWNDDSQVTRLIATKRYVEAGRFPRAEIVVRDHVEVPHGLLV